MSRERWGYLAIVLAIAGLFLAATQAPTVTSHNAIDPRITPSGHVATEEELETAQAEWAQSSHADTYDEGLGANTTCARCKSPLNWDPSQEVAAQYALDCSACKRVPGEERPQLAEGVRVPQSEWRNIPCEICHIPVDESYYTGIAFWNQALGQYEEVENTSELCAKCHEGQHGFEVIEEQEASLVHVGMECSECHGAHGQPSACSDCHDDEELSAEAEHLRHPSVNCTACHDAGGLSIWLETNPESSHHGEYITRRFAHTLTSWPSHNLSTEVYCQRCHHPTGQREATIVPEVGCDECHEHEEGAVSEWCTFFRRDPNPNAESRP